MDQTSSEDATPLIDRMVDGLRGFAPAEDGQFTVDPARVRERLASLKIPVPQHYVLLLIRGALRAGASALDIRADAQRLVLSWPESLDFEDADGFFGRAWSRASPPGWRLLALGMAAASNAGLGSVTLGVRGSGVKLTRDGLDDIGVEPSVGGTRVVVEGSLTAPYYGERIESWVVRKRVRHVDIPVTLDGERVSHGRMSLPEKHAVAVDPYRRRRLDQDDEQQLPPEAEETGVLVTGAIGACEPREIRFLVDGVCVATLSEEKPPEGLVLVASGGFSLDAAEHRVVDDAAYREALRVLHRQKRARYGSQAEPSASEIESQAERARRALTDTGKRRTRSEVLDPAGIPWDAFTAAIVFALALSVTIRVVNGTITANDLVAVAVGGVMITIPFFTLRDARQRWRWDAWVRRDHPPHTQTHALIQPAPDLGPTRRAAIVSFVLVVLAVVVVGVVTVVDGDFQPTALGYAPLAGLYGLVGGSVFRRETEPAAPPEI